ncbi:AAA-type ATPase lid domain-containing protein [Calidifontibacter terrae]
MIESELLPHFPHTVEALALRHHMEDLPRLTQHLLARVSRDNRLVVSESAMNQLGRMPWQGNVEQLRRILNRTAQHRRTGVIAIDDLPPECRAVSRRRFTALESLERDAIVEALNTHGDNKALAAAALGMSRATIYRKIKGYGIHPAQN